MLLKEAVYILDDTRKEKGKGMGQRTYFGVGQHIHSLFALTRCVLQLGDHSSHLALVSSACTFAF